MNDISSQSHDNLDNELNTNPLFLSATAVESQGAYMLSFVLMSCVSAYANIWPVDLTNIAPAACANLLASRTEIQSLLRTSHADGKYARIRNLRM
jgi:hypothetical protein